MMSDTKITIPTPTLSNGIVACLAGPGGTGKSFLALTMAISAATGTTLLPIFTPSKPRRVMALFGQDGFEWVTRRMRSITQLFQEDLPPDAELHQAIRDNLRIQCVNAQPLMESRGKGKHAHPTPFYRVLLREAQTAGLIIIDPLLRFSGLPSDNDHAFASQLMTALQVLAGRGRTVLFTHCVSHDSVRKADLRAQSAILGGSPFIHEPNRVATLRTFDDPLCRRYNVGIMDARKYLKLRVVKDDRLEDLPAPVYLRRYDGGAMRQIEFTDGLERPVIGG